MTINLFKDCSEIELKTIWIDYKKSKKEKRPCEQLRHFAKMYQVMLSLYEPEAMKLATEQFFEEIAERKFNS